MKKIILILCIAASVCKTSAIYAQVNVQDSLALVDLYDSTDGPHWYFHQNWLTQNPVSTWSNVFVDSERVTAVYVDGGLQGAIPSSFGNLTAMTSCSFSNELVTSFPETFKNLIKLNTFAAEFDPALKSLPETFGELPVLKYLYLANDSLESLPESFGNLKKLRILDLSNNQLTNLPESFGNLKNLEALLIRYNKLQSLPSSFGNLENLADFGLEGNELTSLPANFGDLTNLQDARLEYNQLTSLPSSFAGLSVLNGLYLSYNKFTEVPQILKKLANDSLAFLYLDHNLLTGELPHFLRRHMKASPHYPIARIDLSYNYYNYDAGEKLLNRFIFQYRKHFFISPQAELPLHVNGTSISVYAGGTLSNNTYKWFRVNGGLQKIITGDSVFHPAAAGAYYAKITNARATHLNLESDTLNYTVPVAVTNDVVPAKIPVTITTTIAGKLSIYPNPVKDILNFSIENNSGKAAILICDISGKIISEKEELIVAGNNTAIITADLAKGSYFIRVLLNGKEFIELFIKE